MRWTVVEAAEALGFERPSGLDPLAGLAGVSIDSRRFNLESCSSPYTGRIMTGTIMSPRPWIPAQHPDSWRGSACGAIRRKSRKRLFAVDDTLAALQRLATARVNGGGKRSREGSSEPWPVRWARPPQKKFLRRLWARGSEY